MSAISCHTSQSTQDNAILLRQSMHSLPSLCNIDHIKPKTPAQDFGVAKVLCRLRNHLLGLLEHKSGAAVAVKLCRLQGSGW